MTKKLNKHHHSWKIRQYFIFIYQESRSWRALSGYRRCILIISQTQPTWVRVPIPFSIFNIRHLPKIVGFTTQFLITLWVRGYGVVRPFINISAISWRWVLSVEETGVPGENHRPVANHWQLLSHNGVSCTPCLSGIRTHNV